MKTFITLLVALILSAAPALAQTYPTMTTLAANATATQTTLTLTAGTGVAARGGLFIDAEFIPIVSCANAACTLVNVSRTTKPAAHSTSAVVFVVSAAAKANIMLTHEGAFRVGQCSTSTSMVPATALAAYQFLPIIDIDTGDIYQCRKVGAGSSWVWVRTNVQNFNGEAGSVPTTWP